MEEVRVMAVTGETQGRALLRRMDRLPGWPLPRSDFAVLGVAYFFVFYDISDIGFAMPAVAKQYELSDNAVKFVAVAIGLLCYIVGSNIIGALSDSRGRRMAFVTSLVISGVGSLGCALATGLPSLSVWRFVTGMGVGAALNLASTYVGEMSPASQRGRISVATLWSASSARPSPRSWRWAWYRTSRSGGGCCSPSVR